MFQGAKGVEEQSVLRSKVFQGAKGVKKQSVLRSKVFREVKCSLMQSVPQPLPFIYLDIESHTYTFKFDNMYLVLQVLLFRNNGETIIVICLGLSTNIKYVMFIFCKSFFCTRPTYLTWTIMDIFLTTYLPNLVNLVFE